MSNVEVIKAKKSVINRTHSQAIQKLRVCAYCRVSTNSEDQLSSYKSQMKYYTDLIKKNNEWEFVAIYADEAATGTNDRRQDFQRLINDCMNGEIDMVITKSISRFARNTLDTLKYVRMLKEKTIAVYFEDEKINTLTMDGELLLVVLSSVAQQEVENISANVKKGLKMKMKRGELVGFHGCLGYDYHPDDKTITINQQEAEIVRYIFTRYIEGAGGMVIGKELENFGYKTKRNSPQWAESTITGIIRNEKYKGDILMGKTFTVDPISKRRLNNFGEEDKFYIRKHHESIISEEIFEKAQEILRRRSRARNCHLEGGKREKFSRQYAFSCMLECGFCGGTLTRRSWHAGTEHQKTVWQCVTSTKKGKENCPDSKGIPEQAIEKAFVESYRILCDNDKDILKEFLQRMEQALNASNISKQLTKVEKDISFMQQKRSKLVDLHLDGSIDKAIYKEKSVEINNKLEQLESEHQGLLGMADDEKDNKRRLLEFKKTLEQNGALEKFDRYVFESIVEKVIVGTVDEAGNKDPYKLTFIYKTGFEDSKDSDKFKPARKNKELKSSPAELCCNTSDEVQEMCSDTSVNTRGVCSIDVKG
jgi:DNA invertase Pin-like site-specific DNA recombinase